MLMQTVFVTDGPIPFEVALNDRLRRLHEDGAAVVWISHAMAYHGRAGEVGVGMANTAMIVYRPAPEEETRP